ncbi:glutathione S-transferase family protein [Jiella sonneratiae]|uniref:Glutathione S-transferase n=1 Tax=Jiella sonneratiae TaxID=2816856 RepID=A0ABS3J8M2_9HYPH|nr:glutathione S-transferase [Jiella sonneratiae]MBO0905485.1 glutathione S-transferase [Jiella sonneratiae]
MRIFYSPASPFAAKVRMAASHCGLELESVDTDTKAEPADLLASNPLGKIPAVVLDDGTALYDSRTICDYFDKLTGGQLVPQTLEDWTKVKLAEATADGIGDALILVLYEERYRPADRRHQPWVDKQMRKADRGLEVLEGQIEDLPEGPTTAHFAVAGLLGWMSFRFAGKLEAERPALAAWLQSFAETFPAYAELGPRQA